MSDESTFDMMGPEAAKNPHGMYKMLRDHSPVMELPEGEQRQGVLISKHEDVIAVLRDAGLFSSADGALDVGQRRPIIPLELDPPEQTKFRKLMAPLFTPAAVDRLEERTRSLARELVEAVVAKKGCNFHSAVAEPLPSTVFLQLLGLPVSRAAEFIALKDGIIRPPVVTVEERTAYVREVGKKIYAILEEVVEHRVAKREDDWISGFLDSEVDGERLTPAEVVDIGYLFFLAGLDTVTASLDCIITYLAEHPERRQEIVADPSLIPDAIEELLRFETPVTAVVRTATRDTEISGCPVHKGTPVNVLIASANADENFMSDADTVDFHRDVNKHIAFGAGSHRCLGSHLARMELRVVVEEWHKLVPSYSLAPGIEPEYSPGLRQVENLELVW
jgi:cytochrome P450